METPGPLDYKKENNFKHQGPKFLIGKADRERSDSREKYPGVGSYNLEQGNRFSSKLKSAPRCSFGRQKRKGLPI